MRAAADDVGIMIYLNDLDVYFLSAWDGQKTDASSLLW